MKKFLLLAAVLTAFTSCTTEQLNEQEQAPVLAEKTSRDKPPLFAFDFVTGDHTLLSVDRDGNTAPVPVSMGWNPCPGGGVEIGSIYYMVYWNTSGQFLMVERSFSPLAESWNTSVGSTWWIYGEIYWRTSYVKGC